MSLFEKDERINLSWWGASSVVRIEMLSLCLIIVINKFFYTKIGLPGMRAGRHISVEKVSTNGTKRSIYIETCAGIRKVRRVA